MGQRKKRVNDYETRAFKCELRATGGERPKIEGYAAVFNVLSEDLGGFRELIKQGAFRKTISEGDVRALFNHNPDHVLGRTKPGTLTLREDQHGLAIQIDPPNSQVARDLIESIERGDIDAMSFGFEKMKDRWLKEDRQQIRELLEVRLYDVSPVTFPAYEATSIDVRARKMLYIRNRLGQEKEEKIERLKERIATTSQSTASRRYDFHSQPRRYQ